jgi:hypothetical protein
MGNEPALSTSTFEIPTLGFTVVAKAYHHEVLYEIYDIYEPDDRYLHGNVKWDGCSNWHFDAQDFVMLHGCCREDLQRIGDIMALCWDFTAILCPEWNKQEVK